MRKDIKKFIGECLVCQQTKYVPVKPGGLLQPLPIPSNVWEDISMDFVTGLPISGGYSVLFVVVDRFSKYVHLGALQAHYTAYKVAELFVNIVCKLHGLPRSIVSDRDPIFISKFWADLFKFSGTLLRMSSSDHPQSDGQTEVTNRTIEQYLRAFVHQKPSLWHRFLPWAEYHYNTSFHTAAGMTPYQVVYGKLPPAIPNYVAGTSEVAASDDLLTVREEILELLRKNLSKAQKRMKEIADKKRKEVVYEPNSWVFVKLQPYRQTSLTGVKYNKLGKRFYGPFRIIERIGQVAYKLELPSYSKIHNVFHCSLLKLYQGSLPPLRDSLPVEAVDNHPLVSPLAVVGSRMFDVDGQTREQVLVQWNGLPLEDATWEDWQELSQTYNLEDKVGLDGVGIDTNQAAVSPSAVASPEVQPNVGTNMRPVRTKRVPGKYSGHIMYK